MRTKLKRVLSLALLGLGFWLWTHKPPKKILYRGGPILTMDDQDRVVSALLLEGSRIVAVGTEQELQQRAPDAEIRDLHGHALLPGFIDAHGHFPGAGLDEIMVDVACPPLGDIHNITELIARLKDRAKDKSGSDWVVGQRYDDTLLAEHRHPTRQDLDQVSTTLPVVAVHISGHRVVANSVLLRRLQIGKETADPAGGKIQRDANGEPTGLLEETASDLVIKAIPGPSAIQALMIARRASRLYAAQGVTSVQSGLTLGRHRNPLKWMVRTKVIPQRMVMWEADDAIEQDQKEGKARFTTFDEDRLRVGTVKILADGSIQGYTGYLSAPYFVAPDADRNFRGYPRMSKEELTNKVVAYHAQGMQVAVHANGDAAIDDVLDAMDAAQKAYPKADPRFVMVHSQMARTDQLDRMKQLGVIPSFFVLHTYYWGDRHQQIFLGPTRAARISPAQDAVARGLLFTLHADTPVTPMEPLRMVWAAVNRRTTSGLVLGPDQRISVLHSLRAVTRYAAYQSRQEHLIGSLEPGKRADLVILDRSPLDGPDSIDRIRVLKTLVDGKEIYSAPN